MKKRFARIKHYLIAHKGNKFKPGVFAKESVAVLVLVLFIVEGLYVFATPILQNAGFTAAVLPAALSDLTNKDRTATGDSALTYDPQLQKAAQAKADDMAAKGYFAHVSPDGKTPWYWFDSVGYKYTYAGENLAINFTDSSDVETAWMNSPEHHANIVKPEYTQIAIATAQGMYQGQSTTFVVELFAAVPAAKTQPAAAAAPAEPKPVVAAAPAPAPVEAAPSVAPAPVQAPEVLGSQNAPSPTVGAVAAAVSSPNHTLTWVLGIFAALIALLLGMAIFVKMQKKKEYLETAVGGLVLVAIAVVFMMYNTNSASSVQVPHDNQAATAALAL